MKGESEMKIKVILLLSEKEYEECKQDYEECNGEEYTKDDYEINEYDYFMSNIYESVVDYGTVEVVWKED
jgi:hypothetical protein